MRLTRDSFVLWLGIVGAVIGYLIGAGAPPTEWAYGDWLQFASFAVGVTAGKLATSPLKGEHD